MIALQLRNPLLPKLDKHLAFASGTRGSSPLQSLLCLGPLRDTKWLISSFRLYCKFFCENFQLESLFNLDSSKFLVFISSFFFYFFIPFFIFFLLAFCKDEASTSGCGKPCTLDIITRNSTSWLRNLDFGPVQVHSGSKLVRDSPGSRLLSHTLFCEAKLFPSLGPGAIRQYRQLGVKPKTAKIAQ